MEICRPNMEFVNKYYDRLINALKASHHALPCPVSPWQQELSPTSNLRTSLLDTLIQLGMNLNNSESLITSKMNGITVDDMNSLRIGDPEVTEMSIELQKLCDQFTYNVGELQGRLSDVQEVFKELGELADREKIIAMNAANELKMIQSNQDSSKDTMRIQASIQEKAVELEHAKRQLENLKQIEAKQTEYIRKLHLFQ